MRKEFIAVAGAVTVLTAAFLGEVRTSESPVSVSPCASSDIEDDQEKTKLMEKKIDRVLDFMNDSEILVLGEASQKFINFREQGLIKIEPFDFGEDFRFDFIAGYPTLNESSWVLSVDQSILDKSDEEIANGLYIETEVLSIMNIADGPAYNKINLDPKVVRNEVRGKTYAEVTHHLENLDSSRQEEAVSC